VALEGWRAISALGILGCSIGYLFDPRRAALFSPSISNTEIYRDFTVYSTEV